MDFSTVITNLNTDKNIWLPTDLDDLKKFIDHLNELKSSSTLKSLEILEHYQKSIFGYFPYCSDYDIEDYFNNITRGMNMSWSSYVGGNISPDARMYVFK